MILVAMAARLAIEIYGQPGYFETIQASRPYVGLILDLWGAWRVYGPLLIEPTRMPWTIGALLAAGAALAAAVRGRSLRALSRFHQSTLFYALQLAGVLAAIFLLVGTSWRDTRYLYFVQPLLLLLGGAGIVWLAERLPVRAQAWALGGAAALLLLIGLPGAIRATTQQVEGYDRVLGMVSSLRLEGDAVVSPQPPACALVLDKCDGYAIQRGYEEFVIERDGRLVDRWTGAPLINTVEGLEAIARAAPHTWFVTDAFRLATRYDADFLHTLLAQFDLELQAHGVVALKAEGWQEPPALTVSQELTPAVRFGPLALVGWAHGDPNPGQPFAVELTWTGAEPVGAQINTSVRIVDEAGTIVAQQDGPPAKGIIPTTLFFDTPLPDTKTLDLPGDLPIGHRYHIDVTAYTVDGLEPQGEVYPIDWFFLGTTQIPLTPPLGAWENGIVLLGAWGDQAGAPVIIGAADAPGRAQPGMPLSVQISWGATQPITQPLTAFVHLLGPDGSIVAQDDHPPEGGFYPTDRWDAPEHVQDSFTLVLPETLAPGRYCLVTGWYDAGGARVPVAGGGDAIEIASWEE